MNKLTPEQLDAEAELAEASALIVQTCIQNEIRKFQGPLEKMAFLYTITGGLFHACNTVREAYMPHMPFAEMLANITGLEVNPDDEGVLHDEP